MSAHGLIVQPCSVADCGGVEWTCACGEFSGAWSSDLLEAKRGFVNLHLSDCLQPPHREIDRERLMRFWPHYYDAIRDEMPDEREREMLPSAPEGGVLESLQCACGFVVEVADPRAMRERWLDHLDLNQDSFEVSQRDPAICSGGYHARWNVGWVDSNIPEWVERNAEALNPDWHVLVSTIDSGREVTSSPMFADALGFAKESPGQALLLGAGELKRLTTDAPMFFGFDEIWILRHRPSELPDDAPVRLDCSEEPPTLTPDLADWMQRHNVLVGMGDGLGLAFVVRNTTVADAFSFDLWP